MDLSGLIMAFGGGALAAAIGGVPSFIFCGLMALLGIFGGAAGAPGVGTIAFGPFFGPYSAFVGAVAASAYAHSKGVLEDGQDIVTPLFQTGDAMVLVVGGVFGMLGFVLNWALSLVNGGNAWTDTPACCVVILGIVARLAFTKSGITGKYDGAEPRKYFPQGKRLSFLIVFGLGVGIAIGGAAALLGDMAVAGDEAALVLFNNVGTIGFGIAAVGLTFACMGLPFEGYHHVILPAGTTAMIVYASTLNGFAAIAAGAVMGIITSLWGEVMGMTFNSYADSHIDPPASTIWLFQLINFLVLQAFVFVPTGIFAA